MAKQCPNCKQLFDPTYIESNKSPNEWGVTDYEFCNVCKKKMVTENKGGEEDAKKGWR